MPAAIVRNLLETAGVATLATHDAATGHPYASLVEVATLPDGRPVLLLSALARHTRNLEADPRISLLLDRRGEAAAPLASERAAIIGTAARSDAKLCRDGYLARHPTAAAYADFADFGFWTVDIAAAHLIAGFGRIVEVPGAAIRAAHTPAGKPSSAC